MLYTDSIWQNDILGDGFEMRQETLPNNENSKKFTIIKNVAKINQNTPFFIFMDIMTISFKQKWPTCSLLMDIIFML